MNIAMPQKPLRTFQEAPRMIIGIVGVCIRNRDAFGHLLQHGKAHSDVKPIDDMLSPRMQSLGPRSHRVPAIGDEGDGLMVHEALRSQYSANASTSMPVQAMHERKAA